MKCCFARPAKKVSNAAVKTDKSIYEFTLANDKGSTESLRDHLIESKDFDNSMKNINAKNVGVNKW